MPRLRSRTDFAHLLAPGRIGPITVPNRVVLPAMDMNLCHDGEIDETEVAHYANRAAGGTGLIITGACAIAFPQGTASTKEPGLSEDRFIPGLKALTDAVHDAGGLLCVQMTHHGKIARVDSANDLPMLVPSTPRANYDMSAMQDNTMDELKQMASASQGRPPAYREATEEDIAWVIEKFAEAARRVQAAGADAVEIHCGHGYILGGFLCAADNFRTDRWGGSLENRARLAVEVIAAVRAAVGDSMAVIVRLAGKEFGEEGALSTQEAVRASVMFEDAGADAIHVSGWGRNPFSNFTDGPLPDRVGAYREYAAAVKAAVSVPVIAVGRILPELGEEMIAGGECDFVAMGRQLLAEPDLVNKLAAGMPEAVRPCINCYVCVEQNFFDDTPRCAVNPALGDEEAARFEPAARPRHVVVVGGGPGGMEAARVARLRGHRVTLLEAADRLGGTAWFSQLTTPDNGRLIRWLTSEIDRVGVVVKLNHRATVESVQALRPSVVIVATGATRDKPDVPGGHQAHVHTGDTLRALLTGVGDTTDQPVLLRGLGRAGRWSRATRSPDLIRAMTKRFMPLGRNVVVIGGSLVGIELAEFLAERGRTVTVLEPGRQLGLPMASPRRWTAVRRAGEHGVSLVRQAEVLEITPTEVHYRVKDEIRTVTADLVVVASGVNPGAPLAEQLEQAGVETQVIGDAAEVAYIEGAMHSAWRVAKAL